MCISINFLPSESYICISCVFGLSFPNLKSNSNFGIIFFEELNIWQSSLLVIFAQRNIESVPRKPVVGYLILAFAYHMVGECYRNNVAIANI